MEAARQFDLNLLRVLLALDQTRHVTKAAERLQMSQSGFSSALARLRRHSEDALFVRGPQGMVPTPRALRMIDAAMNALAAVDEGVLAPPEFDPMRADTEFRFAMSDLAEIVFLPGLLTHFLKVAPRASLRTDALTVEAVQPALASGEVDLAVGFFPELATQAHFHQRLYRHTFACMVRRGHPLDRGRLTQRAFAQLGHVVVTAPSRSGRLLDSVLKRHGIERRVVLRTPHHLGLSAIVGSTDLIATVPLAAGMRLAESTAVHLVPLPFPPVHIDVHQHWHRRFQHDARHRWLRQQVSLLFNEKSDQWRAAERQLYAVRASRAEGAKPASTRRRSPTRREVNV